MRVRSVFLSDVHLGYRGCRAQPLLEFLGDLETRNLFVNGDLVDLWALRRVLYWPPAHQDVLKALVHRARNGTRVVYVPGNHDDLLRDFCGMRVLNVDVRRRLVHRTADGRRMLVIHGDEFDDVVRFSRFRRALGAGIYDCLLRANHSLDRLRRAFGLGEWSLTAWIKQRAADARRDIDGVLHCNDGDWVENCTALVQDCGGRLSLVRYPELAREEAAPALMPRRAGAG